jgi:transcriptional regulator with XRE-family HTH domain
MSLSEELKRLRKIRNVTLRDVEENTKVSNAYLSQLENGKTDKPSPHVLHKLAGFYGVPYRYLMEAAGYMQDENLASGSKKRRGVGSAEAALMSANLTDQEEKLVASYIEFLRSQRKARKR